MYERINFVSNLTPANLLEKDGKCSGVSFTQHMKDSDGQYKGTNRQVDIDCDFVITALGS